MKTQIPDFQSEDEEREFWATHDSSEYVDWAQAERALFPALKPSTRTISLRLPAAMLDELRQLANQRDIPYHSLIKVFLRERINQELAAGLPSNAAVRKRPAAYLTRKRKK